jgi:hypothetical protein
MHPVMVYVHLLDLTPYEVLTHRRVYVETMILLANVQTTLLSLYFRRHVHL